LIKRPVSEVKGLTFLLLKHSQYLDASVVKTLGGILYDFNLLICTLTVIKMA